MQLFQKVNNPSKQFGRKMVNANNKMIGRKQVHAAVMPSIGNNNNKPQLPQLEKN